MDREAFFELCRQTGAAPFEASFQEKDGSFFVGCRGEKEELLAICGPLADAFHGMDVGAIRLCPRSEETVAALGRIFPWLLPVSTEGHNLTIGFGDRLGIVTASHIASIEGTEIFPVLAQQSKRELSLTGRSFVDMLADVSWQVFKCGYQKGFAADGDHLKTLDEVEQALSMGASMITLECSEHIDNSVSRFADAQLRRFCEDRFAAGQLESWRRRYAGKCFPVGEGEVSFTTEELYRTLALYGGALDFIEKVYKEVLIKAPKRVTFEISIDETDTTTAPSAHYFIAAELISRGVSFDSMAPRFCGEFQKGIDYIGDLEQLDRDVSAHAAIAEHFGYRISVHSGSDKFSAFPVIGKHCLGKFHLKTSGTSWVEALRVIAAADPTLFRRLMHCAKEHFKEAKMYYHVSASSDRVPEPESVNDETLPSLLDEADARQLMHIAYGFLLQEKGPDGRFFLSDSVSLRVAGVFF